MIRCKLISPTNVLLERPMLSPVEFQFIGVKELEKFKYKMVGIGMLAGMIFAMLIEVAQKVWTAIQVLR